jgi:trans-aconitate methyltransferase
MTDSQQSWDPDRYARNAGFVPARGDVVLSWLAPQSGEGILDLGCGDGVLTEQLVAAGARVVAVDAAPEMVAAAQARGLDAHTVDGQALAYTDTFDAVFSNAALHWMREPDQVLDGVARALRPGGRFVGEFGGAGNVQAVVDAVTRILATRDIDAQARNPWFFPTVEDYRARLEAHGFTVDRITLVPRMTPLPGPIADWLDTFCETFLAGFEAKERAMLKQDVTDLLRPTLLDADGIWSVDYVRLRFAARLS